MRLPSTHTWGGPRSSKLRVAFVGDICLAAGLQADLARRGPDYPFTNVRDVLLDADLVVGNLECCIVAQSGMADPPVNRMIVPEHLAAGLAQSSIHVVSLANNHILDGGEQGLVSTQRFLDANGIRHFGAGLDQAAAERPVYVERKGVKIAFLGACDVPEVFATRGRAGVPAIDPERLRSRLQQCRSHADVVIIALHGDLEFTPYPSPGRVRLSRWLVEHGADMVIQHHPHVCQGIEVHGRGLIAYSLGNFIFRVAGNEYLCDQPDTSWGLMLYVELGTQAAGGALTYGVLPVTINEKNETVPSEGDERRRQLAVLAQVSEGLSDWRLLRRERMKRCVSEARAALYRLYYLARRGGVAAMFSDLVAMLRSPYERRWIYSLFSWGMLE